MDKQAAWEHALGLIRIEGLSPTEDFTQLIEREIAGEITLADMLAYLNEKYGLRK